MSTSYGERAARQLLRLVAEGGDTTERGLAARFVAATGDPNPRKSMHIGLKRLKSRGLAIKTDRPFDPRRPDRGNPWVLTDDGVFALRDADERRIGWEARTAAVDALKALDDLDNRETQ